MIAHESLGACRGPLLFLEFKDKAFSAAAVSQVSEAVKRLGLEKNVAMFLVSDAHQERLVRASPFTLLSSGDLATVAKHVGMSLWVSPEKSSCLSVLKFAEISMAASGAHPCQACGIINLYARVAAKA